MVVVRAVLLRRARTAESLVSEIVHTSLAEGRSLVEAMLGCGDVVEQPVCERPRRRVRVVTDDRHALRLVRQFAPFERRSDILSVAGEFLRDTSAIHERG